MPDVAIASWSLPDDDFVRDGAGRLVHARLDEPGMLIARLTESAELAHLDPRRVLRSANLLSAGNAGNSSCLAINGAILLSTPFPPTPLYPL